MGRMHTSWPGPDAGTSTEAFGTHEWFALHRSSYRTCDWLSRVEKALNAKTRRASVRASTRWACWRPPRPMSATSASSRALGPPGGPRQSGLRSTRSSCPLSSSSGAAYFMSITAGPQLSVASGDWRRISWPTVKLPNAKRPSPCIPEGATWTIRLGSGGGGSHCHGVVGAYPAAAIASSSSPSPSCWPRRIRHWLPRFKTSVFVCCSNTDLTRTQTPTGGPGMPKLSKTGRWTLARISLYSHELTLLDMMEPPRALWATMSSLHVYLPG
mmetsp:Transcript_52024/g.146588  ORF Transcript_52024/g.146588 Transcript_52024/m.146588 type:complete len:270 (-) Transcript_52024:418-1227(-)